MGVLIMAEARKGMYVYCTETVRRVHQMKAQAVRGMGLCSAQRAERRAPFSGVVGDLIAAECLRHSI